MDSMFTTPDKSGILNVLSRSRRVPGFAAEMGA